MEAMLMLISPESYYENELKGKSISHIKSEIRRLRKWFDDSKYKAEECLRLRRWDIRPSYSMRARFAREYLEKAKQALVEAGGEYIFTQKEKIDDAFNNEVDKICNIYFEIGGFWGGRDCKNFFVDSKRVFVQTYKLPSDGEYTAFCIRQHELSSSEFLEEIKSLHLSEWKKEYVDDEILDGTQWALQINFTNGRKKKVYGSNAYPYNFDRLMNLLCPEEEE